jgi:hypothetical protein
MFFPEFFRLSPRLCKFMKVKKVLFVFMAMLIILCSLISLRVLLICYKGFFSTV